MENEINSEIALCQELAEDLEKVLRDKFPQGYRPLEKLIKLLKAGDKKYAKILCGNEADKFQIIREEALPIIIEKLYGGSGSPWFTLERKMKQK